MLDLNTLNSGQSQRNDGKYLPDEKNLSKSSQVSSNYEVRQRAICVPYNTIDATQNAIGIY